MAQHYIMIIQVDVHDEAELRRAAIARALAAGLDESEFTELEAESSDPVGFCVGWIFDAGTPDGSGIEITNSSAEKAGI